ncbi:MAG: hypothetical protein IKB20_01470 [Clostridia bacterium]|nr:hypothetical protein [Clostridia bacterium]
MRLFKKFWKNKTAQPENNPTADTTGFKKLKLLVTVVPRRKTEFYLDYLTSMGVNFQTSMAASGTAKSDTLYLLGLEDSDKSVLFSVVNEELAPVVLQGLEEKFEVLKNGKGIAFTVPLTSVIGVSIYRFLSDNRM